MGILSHYLTFCNSEDFLDFLGFRSAIILSVMETSKKMKEPVTLSQIRLDSSLQPRVSGLDNDHVRILQETPETWPPLSVVKQGEQFLLVDGFHRYAAAQNLGLEEINVQILETPLDGDLFALAFQLNAAHGRPLSLQDRRAFAERLLKAHPDWADREIGRRSGLAQPTVAAIRQQLEETAQIEQTAIRKGKGGYTYTVSQESESKKRSENPLPEEQGENAVVERLHQLLEFLRLQGELQELKDPRKSARSCVDALGNKRAKALGENLQKACSLILKLASALQNFAKEKQ